MRGWMLSCCQTACQDIPDTKLPGNTDSLLSYKKTCGLISFLLWELQSQLLIKVALFDLFISNRIKEERQRYIYVSLKRIEQDVKKKH